MGLFNINELRILGRLTRDPEVFDIKGGKKLTKFGVATSESWVDATGERQERTQFHSITCWNEKLGEIAAAQLRKGDLVAVSGSMEYGKYTAKDGTERHTAELAVRPWGGGDITVIEKWKKGGQPAAPKKDDLEDEIPWDDAIPY